MRFDIVANEINAVLSRKERSYDYISLLVLFLERSLVECRYGKIEDLNHFRRLREKIRELVGEYSCSSLFANDIDFEGIETAFDIFNQSQNETDISELGYIFEEFYNREIDEKSGKLIVGSSRKESGMFFSNKALVSFIVRNLMPSNRDFASKTFVDPSMGAGIFLFEVIEQAIQYNNVNVSSFVEKNIYGVDKNPYVVDLFRISLWIKYPSIDFEKLSQHVVCFDSLLTPLFGDGTSWKSYFPEVFANGSGFDFVIGNPPWGRTKANIREYNLFYNTLADQCQGKRMKDAVSASNNESGWLQYKAAVSEYSKKLRAQSDYNHQSYMANEGKTGGDADLYKYFLELSFNILGSRGGIGFIIPASFYINEGAAGLRHLFLENGTIRGLYGFENKKHIFPIHPSYKFLLMLYDKQESRGRIEKAVFNLTDPDALTEEVPGLCYSIEELEICGGEYWTVPECRSAEELKLLRKLYSSSSGHESWKFNFRRELDMSLDSGLFALKSERSGEEKYLPLYEGRMVTQYNCHSKKYIKGNGRTAKWEKVPDPGDGIIGAHYFVKEKDVIARGINTGFRAAYCDVTGQKNVRTVLSTLIPEGTVCGNKVPTCVFGKDDLRLHLLWIGIANSFVVDWMLRKRMSITLNFFHWYQIPFPYMDIDKEEATNICAAVAKILYRNNRIEVIGKLGPSIKEKYLEFDGLANDDLRAMIDVLVADYFGLNLSQLAMILYDFPALDQKVQGVPGDLRYGTGKHASYVTRDKLLKKYSSMHSLPEDNVVEIYRQIGIDIGKCTPAAWVSINDRIEFYNKNNIIAYSD